MEHRTSIHKVKFGRQVVCVCVCLYHDDERCGTREHPGDGAYDTDDLDYGRGRAGAVVMRLGALGVLEAHDDHHDGADEGDNEEEDATRADLTE